MLGVIQMRCESTLEEACVLRVLLCCTYYLNILQCNFPLRIGYSRLILKLVNRYGTHTYTIRWFFGSMPVTLGFSR